MLLLSARHEMGRHRDGCVLLLALLLALLLWVVHHARWRQVV